MGERTALIVGATGLVGSSVLRELLAREEWNRVVAIGRRAPEIGGHPKLCSHIVDFGDTNSWRQFTAVSDVFCTLGTTIRKAGSREEFRRVDMEIPVRIAECSRSVGAEGFHVVSAVGADPSSRFFYNRVKGELESALRQMKCPRLTIVRPSLLLGERDEFRLGEAIGGTVARVLSFAIPTPYRAVHARQVAAALVDAAAEQCAGERIVENAEIVGFRAR